MTTTDNPPKLLFLAHNDSKASWVIQNPPELLDTKYQTIIINGDEISLILENGDSISLDDNLSNEDVGLSQYSDAISCDLHHISIFDENNIFHEEYKINPPQLNNSVNNQAAFGV